MFKRYWLADSCKYVWWSFNSWVIWNETCTVENKYTLKPRDQRPSPAVGIKECDWDMFPNIHAMLQIACTIPMTSCECERSASKLKDLTITWGLQSEKEVPLN